MTSTVQAVAVDGLPRCELAESPRWHDGRWWWVDVVPGNVYWASPARELWDWQLHVATGYRISLVYPAGAGSVLIANGGRLELWDTARETEMNCLLADASVEQGFVLNDGVADRFGRLWIGLVALAADGGGGLLQIDAGGTLHMSEVRCQVSNGLAVDPTGQRMFHADSGAQVVYEHVISSSGIEDTRVFARFDDGLPDGVCCDVAGGVWVAVYGTGEVRRYNAAGQVDAVVTVPTPQTTSVSLGGFDGREMLITTAREGYDPKRAEAEPLAGRLFRARVENRGATVYSVRC